MRNFADITLNLYTLVEISKEISTQILYDRLRSMAKQMNFMIFNI